MTRPHRHKVNVRSVPSTVLLLVRRFSTAHGVATSSSFAFLHAARGFHVSEATWGRASLHGRATRAAKAKVPPVAILASPNTDSVRPSSTAELSEEQAAWLRRIQYYGGRRMWLKAEDKFEQMQNEGVQPTLAICNGLLEAYLQSGRYVNAVGFLEDICLGNIVGNSATGSTINDDDNDQGREPSIDAGSNQCATGTSTAAPRDAAPAPTEIFPNVHTFNLVLATLATRGKWKKALEISAPMRKSFHTPGGRSGDAKRQRGGGGGGRPGRRGAAAAAASATAAVANIAAQILADGETYTHLIVACGKGEQPDKAREMFRDMRAQGINPSPQATAALIRALARAGGDSDEAVSLLADMRAADSRGRGRRGRAGGEDGDGQTEEAVVATEAQSAGFSGAIEACAAAGEWQKAVSLLDEMRLAKITPDSRCYGNAMRACAARGNWQLALALLNTMKKEGVPRMAFNYNVVMQACRKADKNGKAISLLEEMKKDGVAPDIVTYNTCVTIAAQSGRLEQALELLRQASDESGLELDVISYRAALGGLRREKRWEATVKLLGDMQRRGVGPDEVSTAMAMSTCVAAQQPLRALDLFRDMRDVAGVFPGLVSVSALLEALADLGRWEDALSELRALSASGVKPNGRAVAYTMAACNKAKMWKQTLSLDAYTKKMGIVSSMEGLVLVARAYASSKQSQGVLQVLSRAEEICASEAVEIKGEGRGRQQGGGGQAAARLHPPAELYEVAARTLALAGLWEGAASAVRRLEKLPSVRKDQQRQTAASLNTYELIMGAAAAAGQHEAVLLEADAARAALAGAREGPSPAGRRNRGTSADEDTDVDGNDAIGASGNGGELNAAALAHEVAAAGRLGLWNRVSPIMARAMRSPSLRGVAGARLYAALISAAAACGRPERGLEIFREMEVEAKATAAAGVGGLNSPLAVEIDGVSWKGGRGGDRGGGRLPPLDGATFLAALDACAAVGGEESVTLAIGVTKVAAAATAATKGEMADGEEGGRVEGDVAGFGILSAHKLAAVLERAGEVCGAAGASSTADALAAKAVQIAELANKSSGSGAGAQIEVDTVGSSDGDALPR